MHREEVLTFEDLRPPEIPLRTRLHALPPVGIGTPHVESLAGYTSRLALSYCVKAGTLINREILYFVENGEPKRGSDDTTVVEHVSDRVNSLSQISAKWVSALETLTGRNDLRHLTLTAWANVLPPQRLVRDIHCWCPECYQAALDHEQEPYEQLLWSVREVVVCPIHRKPLLTSCPHCGKEQRPLAWRSRPGFCAKCHAWLGEIRTCPEASAWDIWRADAVGELLAAGPRLAAPPAATQISAAIQTVAQARGFNRVRAFARYLEFDRGSVIDWMKGRRKPFFDSLLVVCAKLGVTPLQFLTLDANQLQGVPMSNIEDLVPTRRYMMRTGAESKRLIIESIKAGSPFDSISDICKRAGVGKQYISAYIPDIVEQLKIRRQRFIAAKRSAIGEEFRRDVIEVITALRRENTPVTVGRVARRLKKGGFLRAPQWRAVFRQIFQEEGIIVESERNCRRVRT